MVPIKARSGGWSEHPFILVDEICDGGEYFLGGYAAANYWRLTEQVPMQMDVYTTRKQGTMRIMNNRLVFHRTTKKRLQQAVERKIGEHPFRVLNKEEAKKWIALRY